MTNEKKPLGIVKLSLSLEVDLERVINIDFNLPVKEEQIQLITGLLAGSFAGNIPVNQIFDLLRGGE